MFRRTLLATIAGAIPPFLPFGSPRDVPKDPRPRVDGQTTAVVDRIEDGTAVVLFETLGFQRTVPVDVLPANAREEGIVLRVPDGDDLALAEVDREATEARRATAEDRFDELSERPD